MPLSGKSLRPEGSTGLEPSTSVQPVRERARPTSMTETMPSYERFEGRDRGPRTIVTTDVRTTQLPGVSFFPIIN